MAKAKKTTTKKIFGIFLNSQEFQIFTWLNMTRTKTPEPSKRTDAKEMVACNYFTPSIDIPVVDFLMAGNNRIANAMIILIMKEKSSLQKKQ